MLLALNLKNFAVIDNLSIDFGKGLNIITGETGAGKSIIVDAINIILGDRASPEVIKSGREEAEVEALFEVGKADLIRERLESLGFKYDENELLIRRVVSRKGRGRVFIGGNLATFSILERLTDGVVDIFSQHEHQTLLKEDNHLSLLDEFGRLKQLTEEFGKLYREYSSTKRELSEHEDSDRRRGEREDLLRFQCAEIDAARLERDEDEILEIERKKLANAERLYSIAQEAYQVLYEGEKSIVDILNSIKSNVREAIGVDETLSGTEKSLERATAEIKETAITLRDYASSVQFDPDRLSYVEARLREINRLKKKYGSTIEEILEKRVSLGEELTNITAGGERAEELRIKLKQVESEINRAADELSEKRRRVSPSLVKGVETELSKVGIKNGRFVVHFDTVELSSNGRDRVVFLFSANPDEAPKPLVKVASGGELSRIMLVLKEILARIEGGLILIFDEADSGIGGAMAEAVGHKIKNLSRTHQVICITHLPQVAKFADIHFVVTKTFSNNTTRVEMRALDKEERVKELARMLGGLKITEKTVEVAREMLKQ